MNGVQDFAWQLLLLVISLAYAFPGQAQVTFSAPVSYSVGTNPGSVITGDFDGDGIVDLAVANTGDPSAGDLGSVSLLLGKGDGTFLPALNSPAGPFPTILLAGDFNGDGKLDLLVEGGPPNTAGTVPWTLLFGKGDGTFAAPSQIALKNFTPSIVVGDFNNDKKMDLISIDQASGSMEYIRGNGDGTFQPAQTIAEFGPGQLVSADFNGDGKPDLATGVGSTIQVLIANGDGTFKPAISRDLGGAVIQELLAADVNDDGKMDLITTSARVVVPLGCEICIAQVVTDIRAHLSDGNGSFEPSAEVATAFAIGTLRLKTNGDVIGPATLGDFDGDGNIDIAYQKLTVRNAVVTGTSLVMIGGKGDGTFPTDLGAASGAFNGSLIATDFNRDRLADLGIAPLTSSTIGIVLNTTQGFWLGAPASLGPIRAGDSVTGTISVNPQNGFDHAVELTCSAPQFVGIACTLSPPTVKPGDGATLTVITTGNSATLLSPRQRFHPGWLYVLSLPIGGIVFGRLGFGAERTGRRKLVLMALGCGLFVGMTLQIGCGAGGSKASGESATPSGKYTITVTGASGVRQRSATVAVAVQ